MADRSRQCDQSHRSEAHSFKSQRTRGQTAFIDEKSHPKLGIPRPRRPFKKKIPGDKNHINHWNMYPCQGVKIEYVYILLSQDVHYSIVYVLKLS